MRALLDTHAFLWWISDDRRLSERAREIIGDGRNELFFSAASGWEISIKAGLGRLEVPDNLERFIPDQLFRNAFQSLPIYLRHALPPAPCPIIIETHSTASLSHRPFLKRCPCSARTPGSHATPSRSSGSTGSGSREESEEVP